MVRFAWHDKVVNAQCRLGVSKTRVPCYSSWNARVWQLTRWGWMIVDAITLLMPNISSRSRAIFFYTSESVKESEGQRIVSRVRCLWKVQCELVNRSLLMKKSDPLNHRGVLMHTSLTTEGHVHFTARSEELWFKRLLASKLDIRQPLTYDDNMAKLHGMVVEQSLGNARRRCIHKLSG